MASPSHYDERPTQHTPLGTHILNSGMCVGDKVYFYHADGDNNATILDFKESSTRGPIVCLKVEGWLGTTWERFDHHVKKNRHFTVTFVADSYHTN